MARTDPLPTAVFRGGTTVVVREPDCTVVWLRGEHDMATVPELSEAMAAAIGEDQDVVIDLSAVEFLDSTTLNVLTRTHTSLGLDSRSMVVRAPSPPLRRVLELRGIGGLIRETAADGYVLLDFEAAGAAVLDL